MSGRPPPPGALRSGQRDPNERKSRVLFVRNVSYEANEKDVKELFERHGDVKKTFMLISRRGIGFITYHDIRDAERAKRELTGHLVCGRPIDVHYSLPRDGGGFQGGGTGEDDGSAGVLQVILRELKDPSQADSAAVEEFFSGVGEIKEFSPLPNPIPDSKDVYFAIEFYDTRACEKAIDKYHDTTWDKGRWHITWAKPELVDWLEARKSASRAKEPREREREYSRGSDRERERERERYDRERERPSERERDRVGSGSRQGSRRRSRSRSRERSRSPSGRGRERSRSPPRGRSPRERSPSSRQQPRGDPYVGVIPDPRYAGYYYAAAAAAAAAPYDPQQYMAAHAPPPPPQQQQYASYYDAAPPAQAAQRPAVAVPPGYAAAASYYEDPRARGAPSGPYDAYYAPAPYQGGSGSAPPPPPRGGYPPPPPQGPGGYYY
eukprot:m51a1_g549 hypothetical protein (437) ;mRNA; r:445993-447915